MLTQRIVIAVLSTAVWLSYASDSMVAVASAPQDTRNPKTVTRAERPKFTKSDWDGIYFENLLEEGLVGERPSRLAPGEAPAARPTTELAVANGAAEPSGEATWSALISSTTIEDEVKSLQKRIATDITTPVRFRSEYSNSHQSFSVLSMMFAVISQYEGTVRWKDDAAKAQVAFWRAASAARVGTTQAYESCKSKAEIIAELVRGGKFTGDEKEPDEFDWSNIVDRNPLMHRLQHSLDTLKSATANRNDFALQTAEVNHESEMIALIAHVLAQPNMSDADDDGYAEHAAVMKRVALQAVQATQLNDFDAVSRAVNGINQACDACHGDWR